MQEGAKQRLVSTVADDACINAYVQVTKCDWAPTVLMALGCILITLSGSETFQTV